DFKQAVTQCLDDAQRALRSLLGLIRMRIGNTVETRNGFVHARVVLHRAGTERVHAEIDGVVPRREPREVANDFDFADLGHVAEVFSFGGAQELLRIHFRDVEWRQLPCGFAGRGLFKDQAFVLVDVARRLAGHVFHRVTSSSAASSWCALRTERSLSATWPAAVSMMLREVNSVQHHSDALPSSG